MVKGKFGYAKIPAQGNIKEIDTMREYSFISKDDERIDQFSSKVRAQRQANLMTQTTGRRHQVFLTTTWRDLTPRVCWTVCLGLVWRHGNLVTE